MKMVTDVQIDLYGEIQYYMASAKQGDKATRYLRIQLMNNGNEFQIPDDVILIANIKKPDGKFCYNECEREGNRVMVQLTNQALAAAGTAYCDIEMRSSNWELILSSAAFTVEIEPSMRNEGAIESSNEMTFLEKKVQHYIDRLLSTEQQVITTETAVKLAETARTLAEDRRVEQENIRERNENERILAEQERRQQEQQRQLQEQQRQQQEQKRQTDTAEAIRKAGVATDEAERATGECNDATQRAETALENEAQLAQTMKNAEAIRKEVLQMQSAVETMKRNVEKIKEDVQGLLDTGEAGLMSNQEREKLAGIAEGANKYTHPTNEGNKHIPAGGSSGKILRWSADGTATWGDDKDTTYAAMAAATALAAGKAGLVPAPAAGAQAKYLRGDGTWQTPTNTTYGVATQKANGLLSAADKKKMDGIAANATKNVITFATAAPSTLADDAIVMVYDIDSQ